MKVRSGEIEDHIYIYLFVNHALNSRRTRPGQKLLKGRAVWSKNPVRRHEYASVECKPVYRTDPKSAGGLTERRIEVGDMRHEYASMDLNVYGAKDLQEKNDGTHI